MDLELGQHSVPLFQQLPLRPEQQVNHCSTVTVARAVVCSFNATSHLILKFGEAITIIIQFSWVRRQTQWRAEPHLGTGRVLEPSSFCVQLICLNGAALNSGVGQNQAGMRVNE